MFQALPVVSGVHEDTGHTVPSKGQLSGQSQPLSSASTADHGQDGSAHGTQTWPSTPHPSMTAARLPFPPVGTNLPRQPYQTADHL